MMNSTPKKSTGKTESFEFDDFFCFVDEIRFHIDRMDGSIESYLNEKERIPDTKGFLRSMHSIKGAAGFWNVPAIQEAAHRAETCLVEIENGARVWSEATASIVLNACQELRHLLQVPLQVIGSRTEPTVTAKEATLMNQEKAAHWCLSVQGLDETDDLDGLHALLENMTDCVQLLGIRVLTNEHRCWTFLSTLLPDELVAIFKMHLSQARLVEISPIGASPLSGELSGAKGLAKTLRVHVTHLSALQCIAGQLADLKEGSSSQQTAALVLQLNQHLDNIRLVTVSETLARYEPMVQSLAQRLQKKIAWHLNGGDTLVDRRLMERVNEPLMHLVRNSCDHGIETEPVRLANGKLPCGNIRLDVFRTGAGLHFHLMDDGAGLSRHALLERARLKGLAVPKDPVDDAEIWSLIFEPGFSTASQVTDISGRGVGLDVVRQTILDLGGDVHLECKEGAGLSFEINVPEPSGW